ncbi:unnamed protein product [Lampetra fluviatilis]
MNAEHTQHRGSQRQQQQQAAASAERAGIFVETRYKDLGRRVAAGDVGINQNAANAADGRMRARSTPRLCRPGTAFVQKCTELDCCHGLWNETVRRFPCDDLPARQFHRWCKSLLKPSGEPAVTQQWM